MNTKHLLAGLALGIASTTAAAEGIRYTYLEATHQIYSKTDLYQWELKASYRINDQFYVALEDSNWLNSRSVSGGLILPLQDTLHVYVQLGLGDNAGVFFDEDFGPQGNDSLYPIIEGGLRAAVSDQIELRGALRLEPEAYANDSEISIILEGAFHLTSDFSLTAGVVLPDEAPGSVIRLGGRFHF
jgi:hypothetical protein